MLASGGHKTPVVKEKREPGIARFQLAYPRFAGRVRLGVDRTKLYPS